MQKSRACLQRLLSEYRMLEPTTRHTGFQAEIREGPDQSIAEILDGIIDRERRFNPLVELQAKVPAARRIRFLRRLFRRCRYYNLARERRRDRQPNELPQIPTNRDKDRSFEIQPLRIAVTGAKRTVILSKILNTAAAIIVIGPAAMACSPALR
jgi:hypothetical protein